MTEDKLIPPRFWWLKRIGRIGAAYVLLLIGTRIWWGWEADRRFRAAVEQRRAAGEPVLLEDFVTAPIPDEENAAYFLGRAVQALALPAGVKDLNDLLADQTQLESQKSLHAALLNANQETLRLIREARARPAADWKLPLASPIVASSYIPALLPHLSSQRQLAKFLVAVSRYKHLIGDDQGALEAVRDMLMLGDRIDGQAVITELVRIATDRLAFAVVEDIAPTLQVGGRGSDGSGGAAARQDVADLICELLNEVRFRGSHLRDYQFEVLVQIDTTRYLARAGLKPAGFRVWAPPPSAAADLAQVVLLSPAWTLEGVELVEHCGSYGRASLQPDWNSAAREIRWHAEPAGWADGLAHAYGRTACSSLEGNVEHFFRTLAARRMAAIALAIRLYELDLGARPGNLGELVPDYLPAVPHDPFGTTGAEIRYKPNNVPPVLYSINVDGIDDGGQGGPAPGQGGGERAALDVLFYLNGDRPRIKSGGSAAASQPAATRPAQPTPPASTQTAPDNLKVEDAQRDGGR